MSSYSAERTEVRTRRSNASMKHAFAIAAMAVVLGGCASVRVSDVVSAPVPAVRPAEILVEVINGLTANDPLAQAADKVAFNLQTALLQKLTRAGLTVEPLASGKGRPDAAVLRVSITEAKPGNALQRFVIGFGVGRAELLARTDFGRPTGPMKGSMSAFNTSSGSGFKPGILLPGAIALATRDVVHLASGGAVGVSANFRGGLEQAVRATTSAIVSQLEKYYVTVGWGGPRKS
jgi:hypothetical protein